METLSLAATRVQEEDGDTLAASQAEKEDRDAHSHTPHSHTPNSHSHPSHTPHSHITLTEAWNKTTSLLKTLLERDLVLAGECLVEMCTSGRGNSVSCSASYSSSDSLRAVGHVLLGVSRVMTQLLVAANREKIASVFQSLHNEVHSRTFM